MDLPVEQRELSRSKRINLGTRFNALMVGDSISTFGTQLSAFAIPTYAIKALHATPREIGILNTLQWVPPLFFIAFAGLLADLFDRGRQAVLADIGCAIAGLVFYCAIIFGFANIFLLDAVVFLVGSGGAFYGIAASAMIPQLVEQQNLVHANSRFTAARAVSSICGQGLAAILAQLRLLPVAILTDAVSYLVRGAFNLRWLASGPKNIRENKNDERHNIVEPATGIISFLKEKPAIVHLALAAGTFNLGASIIASMYFPFVYQVLELSPLFIGISMGFGSFSSFLTAMYLPKFLHAKAFDKVVVWALFAASVGAWCVPLAHIINAHLLIVFYRLFFSAASTSF
ncbi:MAG: MFS transporter, partial [Acidocella sp.]|nr:MFS transporter [Acidocella sp.]